MKYTASNLQVLAIKKRMETALSLGDLSAFIRAQSLYMILSSGLSIIETAHYARKSHECVRSWLAEFLLKGVASLKIKWPTGRQPKLSKSKLKELKNIVENPPSNMGYDGGCWNVAMICDLIKKLF